MFTYGSDLIAIFLFYKKLDYIFLFLKFKFKFISYNS